MKLDEKIFLERIASAVENMAGIEHTDKGYLDSKTYLERIADALEAGITPGGGGSQSSITTAYITINATAPEGYTADYIEGNNKIVIDGTEFYSEVLAENNVLPVKMYNGVGYINFRFADTVAEQELFIDDFTSEGNFRVDSYGYYAVTGDDTVAITLTVNSPK